MSDQKEMTPDEAFEHYSAIVDDESASRSTAAESPAPEPKRDPDPEPEKDRTPEPVEHEPSARDAEPLDDAEALRAELARLRQENASHRGRQAALDRQAAELAARAKAPAKDGAPDDDDEDADIKALVEEYPDVGKPIVRQIEALKAQLSELMSARKVEMEARTEADRLFLAENANQVEARHNGYVDYIAKNLSAFKAWRDDQPKAIRDAVDRNADDVYNPAEAIRVLDAFKAHMAAKANPNPEPNPEPSRRERQRMGALSPRGVSGATVRSGEPDGSDPKASFDYYSKLIDQGLA